MTKTQQKIVMSMGVGLQTINVSPTEQQGSAGPIVVTPSTFDFISSKKKMTAQQIYSIQISFNV